MFSAQYRDQIREHNRNGFIGVCFVFGGLIFLGFAAKMLTEPPETSQSWRRGNNMTAEQRGVWACPPDQPPSSRKPSYVKGSSSEKLYRALVCVNKVHQSIYISPNTPKSILTYDEAVEFGLKPNRLNYDQKYKLSHGVINVASVVVPSVRIGDVEVRDVSLFVARDHDIRAGLLGRDFLSRLKHQEIASADVLVMAP